jgi:arylsulfatase A-like enzyme
MFAAVLLAGVLSAAGCAPSEPVPPGDAAESSPVAADPPNVVLIIVDTLRADRLGCYGFPGQTSPEIDALAAGGVRFERVIAPASWTRPSIGALLTGHRPRTLGLYRERAEILAERFTTLAEILRDNGYTTAGMTANPHINSSYNFDQGFKTYLDSHVLFPFMKPAGEQKNYNKSPLRSARQLFTGALELAREAARPGYLQINIMEVHEYNRGANTLTRGEFQAAFRGIANADYHAALRQASHDIGEFVSRLTALPGWEDTLFVITSDHGEGLDDHPGVLRAQFHGFVLYESQVAVPLILYRPGWLPANRVVRRPVRLVDLLPTLLDHLGIAVPGGITGRSLLPLIDGAPSGVDLPPYFIAESRWRDVNKIAVYGDDWKYIDNRDNWVGVNPQELQPRGGGENGAWTDRIGEQQVIAAAMRAYLAAWEKANPAAVPTLDRDALSPEEEDQLESIGYF